MKYSIMLLLAFLSTITVMGQNKYWYQLKQQEPELYELLLAAKKSGQGEDVDKITKFLVVRKSNDSIVAFLNKKGTEIFHDVPDHLQTPDSSIAFRLMILRSGDTLIRLCTNDETFVDSIDHIRALTNRINENPGLAYIKTLSATQKNYLRKYVDQAIAKQQEYDIVQVSYNPNASFKAREQKLRELKTTYRTSIQQIFITREQGKIKKE